MKKTIYTCDRCEIEAYEYEEDLNNGVSEELRIVVLAMPKEGNRTNYQSVHICEPCAESLDEWFKDE